MACIKQYNMGDLEIPPSILVVGYPLAAPISAVVACASKSHKATLHVFLALNVVTLLGVAGGIGTAIRFRSVIFSWLQTPPLAWKIPASVVGISCGIVWTALALHGVSSAKGALDMHSLSSIGSY